MSVATVARIASTIASALVALCFLNRPRFWWQEVVCNLSLYLLPLLAGVFVSDTRCLLRARGVRVLALVSALASSIAVYCILSVLTPYLRYTRWQGLDSPSEPRLRLLFVDDCSVLPHHTQELLRSYNPNLVVATGAARASALADREAFPHHRDFGAEKGLMVESSLELEDRGVPTLGFNSQPGGIIGVRLASGEVIDLGVVNLTPAFNKSDFERNRVSARRLASYMRNSDSNRVVVGNLYATPFSQLTSVFTSQARLRSLWYGKGLVKTYDMNHWYSHLTFTHGFMSRDVLPARVERFVVPGCSLAGFFADFVVAETSHGVMNQRARELTMDDVE